MAFGEDPKTNAFLINGQVFNMDDVMHTMKLDTVEEWTIRNEDNGMMAVVEVTEDGKPSAPTPAGSSTSTSMPHHS